MSRVRNALWISGEVLKDLVRGFVRDEAPPVLVPVATQASSERTRPSRLRCDCLQHFQLRTLGVLFELHLAAQRTRRTLKTYRWSLPREALSVVSRRAGHWLTLASVIMSLLATASNANDVRQSGTATEARGDALALVGLGGRVGASPSFEHSEREYAGAFPRRVGHAVVGVLYDGFHEARPPDRDLSEMFDPFCGENFRSCLIVDSAEHHYRMLICLEYILVGGTP